jgi:hypothetical protein
MNSFYEHHKDSIRWHYRCFDRILLNGLIQPFQQLERALASSIRMAAISGDTIHAARHRRPISALGEGTSREARYLGRGGAEGAS